MSSKSISLKIWSHCLEVFIYLIGRDKYSSFNTLSLTNHLKYIYRSHHICLKSSNWITITFSNKWLSCKVKNYLRLINITNFLKMRNIINVSENLSNVFFKIKYGKKIGVSRWRKRISNHIGTKGMEPERKPRTLKSGGSCYKDSFSCVKMRHDYEIIFFISCSTS